MSVWEIGVGVVRPGVTFVEIYFKQWHHDEVNKKVNRTLRRTTRLRKKRQ
jgi:hypothetical protein